MNKASYGTTEKPIIIMCSSVLPTILVYVVAIVGLLTTFVQGVSLSGTVIVNTSIELQMSGPNLTAVGLIALPEVILDMTCTTGSRVVLTNAVFQASSALICATSVVMRVL